MSRSSLQAVEPIPDSRDGDTERGELRRDLSQQTWLTSHEACDYLRFCTKNRLISLYRFLKVNGVATVRRGKRRLLIARADLDRAIGARKRSA